LIYKSSTHVFFYFKLVYYFSFAIFRLPSLHSHHLLFFLTSIHASAVHAKQQKVELLRRLNKDGAEAQDRREEDKKGGTREVGQVLYTTAFKRVTLPFFC